MRLSCAAALLCGAAASAAAPGEERSRGIFHGYRSSAAYLPRVPVIKSPTGQELIAAEDLPKAFDWRDVDGTSYVTDSWNQHIPQYCGACWIHGTLSTLNDRLKVARKAQWPDVRFGRQGIINCVPNPENPNKPPPGCDGGDAYMIHEYLHKNPMPDDTCLPYQAKNMACEKANVCRNCLPNGTCWAVENYPTFGVSEYGNVTGELAMMKEIYARGPIACSFAAPDTFMMKYAEISMQNDGVFVTHQHFTDKDVDHVMEVAGWGETKSGMKYWVIRNSWGTYWGEMGWLKLQRGVDAMKSESAGCDWAIPTWDGMQEVLDGKKVGQYVEGDIPVHASLRAQMAQASVEAGSGGAAAAQAAKAPSKDKGPARKASAEAQAVTPAAPTARGGDLGDLHDFGVFAAGVLVALGVVRVTGRGGVRQPELLG